MIFTLRKVLPTLLLIAISSGAPEIAEGDEISGATGKPWDAVSFDVAYDVPPVVVKAVRPEYPKEARKAEVEGDVILIIYIDENGDVRNAIIQQSPGSAALEEAAKEAAYKCKFEPARQNGEPVGTWYSIVMQFRL